MLDAWICQRAERALCSLPALLLEHLEFLQEQGGGQDPPHTPLAARIDREAGDRQRWLRLARVRKARDLESLGGGGAAEGHALSLPEPIQPPDAVGCSLPSTAQDCGAELQPGDDDQDVSALRAGREDGGFALLGRRRVRRLHAKLRTRGLRGGLL